ncbi:hypothetical protein GCM10010149_50910 [Nonomuraea roseoviolacea subsp. roseoviolacea]|uniref:Arsenate reductase n=1 Tax=Nonomuraea roseoviolacea subsp. carminata TaxID=160689 RepID=A0ABT1KGZ3_9ACTN|nr:hypothetical protein [Nonomuraea roseoviolacea]MCP2352914.1 hypothetical protein [Nonomuraea roseoviolacea subsp. carminata]
MTPDISLDPGWVPSACTLPTAERPLRVAEFDALFAEAVREVRRPAPERLRLELVFSPDNAARAAGLTARESGCCSFFVFTLTVSGGGLALEVAVPPGRTGVLDALRARVAAVPGTA